MTFRVLGLRPRSLWLFSETLWMDFDIASNECWVLYHLEQNWLSGSSELKIKVTKAIFRKVCYGSSAYIHWWILIQLHTNVLYDNISSKFNFRGTSIKVKVVLAIFRKKNFIIALVPTFINGFKYNFMLMFLEQKKIVIALVPTFIKGF